MKKLLFIVILLISILSCGAVFAFFAFNITPGSVSMIGGANGPTAVFVAGKTTSPQIAYTSISMEEAQKIFNSAKESDDYILIDVRREDEFAQGHLPGAVNLPNQSIAELAPEALPDFEQTIYVYCRSGNRSKQASKTLADMGYLNVIEIGGILDWNGELEY